MNSLPNDLILVIIDLLDKITDKRRFSKTCKFYNRIIKKLIGCEEKNFRVKYKISIFHYCKEKFTLELCHDGYFCDIPRRYFNNNNRVLMELLTIYGNLNKLKYAMKRKCILPIAICEIAAQYGHLNIIIWAQKYGVYMRNVCSIAAKFGHLNIIKWAKNYGHDWQDFVCENAALNGHLDILIWARENGCDWDSKTCRKASLHGHLNVLIWARENGCDWDSSVCNNAVVNGHLEIVKWALKNGCELDVEVFAAGALMYGHFDILIWAKENGYY